MAAARASLGRILPESSVLFLCDMQEKFRPSIAYFPQIVSVAARMLKVPTTSVLQDPGVQAQALLPQTQESSAQPSSLGSSPMCPFSCR